MKKLKRNNNKIRCTETFYNKEKMKFLLKN